MAKRFADLARTFGARVLPFTNPRVVSPPGRPVANGARNILVVTPRRSGTHILIDMILNNVPAYRRHPLYIDLDQCWKQRRPGHDLIGAVSPDAGYVIKSHMPIDNGPEPLDPEIANLIDTALVITIRRDTGDITRSLTRWYKTQPKDPITRFEGQIDDFHAFWDRHERIEIAFEDLFDAPKMQSVIADICARTQTRPAARFRGPAARGRPMVIYLWKTATRLLGRHSPRIDTTIHTLKG
jgi:hypothetical protein